MRVGLNAATRVCDVNPEKCWFAVLCWFWLQCSLTLRRNILPPTAKMVTHVPHYTIKNHNSATYANLHKNKPYSLLHVGRKLHKLCKQYQVRLKKESDEDLKFSKTRGIFHTFLDHRRRDHHRLKMLCTNCPPMWGHTPEDVN